MISLRTIPALADGLKERLEGQAVGVFSSATHRQVLLYLSQVVSENIRVHDPSSLPNQARLFQLRGSNPLRRCKPLFPHKLYSIILDMSRRRTGRLKTKRRLIVLCRLPTASLMSSLTKTPSSQTQETATANPPALKVPVLDKAMSNAQRQANNSLA